MAHCLSTGSVPNNGGSDFIRDLQMLSSIAHPGRQGIGPGARQSKLETGGTENELIVRLAGRYAWQINDNAKFTQELSADIGGFSFEDGISQAELNLILAKKEAVFRALRQL